MKKERNPADYIVGDDVEVTDVDLDQEDVYVNGQRLTDERVEQMAEESVRLARDREANLIPGGKSLSGGAKHSPAVQVVVSETTYARLKDLARNRKMSVSKLLRPVLDEFAKRETRRSSDS
jgi:fructose-bisphosphate aldolase class 1